MAHLSGAEDEPTMIVSAYVSPIYSHPRRNGGHMIRLYALPAGLLLLSLLIQPARAADVSEKKAAELKWAKGVAVDFLDAAFNGHLEQAESLIDSSLKASFAREG